MSIGRALVCAPLMPEFDRESGSRRIFNLIEFLRETGWAVTFAAQNGAGGERYARVLRQLGVTTYSSFEPVAEQLMSMGRFDLAIFAFWHLAEAYMPLMRQLSPRTRVVVDSIDLHFMRNARRAFGQAEASQSSGALDPTYASEMMRELNIYAAADAVLTVSQKEAELVNDMVGAPALAYAVPDCEDLPASPLSFSERQGILFVGNYRHPPNLQAVEYLCEKILPRIQPAMLAQHPVYIVGNGLDTVMQTVSRYTVELPSVFLVGWVPSVLPYLQRARVSVIPLLYGAGTKRKLIQALMVGTPSVSTSIGIEGLHVQHGEHVLVADDAESFAACIVQLLQERTLWQELACQGQTHIRALHGRQTIRTRFQEVLAAILTKEAKSTHGADSASKPHTDQGNGDYGELVRAIQAIVESTLPASSTVLVVSKGDTALLQMGDRTAWHFPQTDAGVYAGQYPADSAAAIAHLEVLRARGAEFLLFPATGQWWLQHYAGFRLHLETRYQCIWNDEDCVIYQLD